MSCIESPMAGDGMVLAIDLGGTKIAMAIATADGSRLAETRIPTLAERGAADVMARLLLAAKALVERISTSHSLKLAAIGAVTPGIVLADSILLAPNNPGWDSIALRSCMQNSFDVARVAVDTDVKAAAFAELRWGQLQGSANGLFVNLGTGIAAAAVIDGKVLRGTRGVAGEIGYQLLGQHGEPSFADGRAPLEEMVSGSGIAKRAASLLGRPIDTEEVFLLAARNQGVAAILAEAWQVLGRHLANIALVLDPEKIVIAGGMTMQSAMIIPALTAVMQRAVPFPPRIVVSSFPMDAALQGAVLLASEQAWPCNMKGSRRDLANA